MEFSYVEAFRQYYCDAAKKGKLIHKNMLLAFINECYNEKNVDYNETIVKITDKTLQPFLSIKQFDRDYAKLAKKLGTVYKENFDTMVENSYGKVNWDNLKF
ncbi:MAG: hypothetical protein LUG12_08170 [Erysipelotrichaceae bacterium]|nr:hypothetical protein [Erysipelotrichaceae bacterium]